MTHSSLAFVFPGQGSQQLGMLKESAHLPIVVEVFTQASQVVGKDLWQLTQLGPESELNNTLYTQPILLATGVALWRIWQANQGLAPKLLAGHSLGEYTALVCANALSLSDGIKLVTQRARFMQEAVAPNEGAMAAILGLTNEALQAICQQAAQQQVVAPVNFNAIGQTVIAGHRQAVTRAVELAKEKGAKGILLPISVPSHCELMRSAAQKLAQELVSVKMVSPTIPIIHNVNVEICRHVDDIRQCLVEQLYSAVRWVETIQRFAQEGIKNIIECGPGKVLSGLTKRIDSQLKSFPIEQEQDRTLALEITR